MKTKVLSLFVGLFFAQTSFAHVDYYEVDYFDDYGYLMATESCAKSAADIPNLAPVKNAVNTFGGLNRLVGVWKLGGLAGDLQKLIVEFRSNESGFFVKVNKDPNKQLHLCVDSREPQVLRLRVLEPATPQNALFLVKNREVGKSINIAADASDWKYMKFNRIAN